MKPVISRLAVLLVIISMYACKKNDPDKEPALPSYLVVPSSLDNYTGSGRIAIDGGLKLMAEGVEHKDASNTYSGVLGNIIAGTVRADFTVGQPLPYSQNGDVPQEYRANGALAIIGTHAVGTYSFGLQATPSPKGEYADLSINLPGPQYYFADKGTLTITESTLIKTQGTSLLYRLQGTFQSTLTGTGTGLSVNNPPAPITGTFDLLFVSN